MPNSQIYLILWAPLILIGIVFQIMTLIVYVFKRNDYILGTSFFRIHIALGIFEIAMVKNIKDYL